MDRTCDTSSNENLPVARKERNGGHLNSSSDKLTLYICPTTGGQLEFRVARTETVQGLQRLLARKLKLPKERINLLHRDRLLKDGPLSMHEIADGSRLTLIPNVESGLLSQTQKPEQASVLQALQGLSESQVSDFLSGRSPMTLAMRLGDHMMFVQLQLSTSRSGRKHRPKASMSSCNAFSSNQDSLSGTSVSSVPNAFPQSTPLPPTTGRFSSGSPFPHRIRPHHREGPLQPRASHHCSTLGEASQNLSQRLQELTQLNQAPARVSTGNSPRASPEPRAPSQEKTKSDNTTLKTSQNPRATIESMQHHGRGVYSGTFSGTLNPALQDRDGQPKRNISTIIHILNDLLGAGPGSSGSNPSSGLPKSRPSSIHPPRQMQGSPTLLSPPHSPTEENKVTRSKMEQLQSMLHQRRQRRKARREARSSPYTMWSSTDHAEGRHALPTQKSTPEIDANLDASNVTTNMDADNSYPNLTQQTMVA